MPAWEWLHQMNSMFVNMQCYADWTCNQIDSAVILYRWRVYNVCFLLAGNEVTSHLIFPNCVMNERIRALMIYYTIRMVKQTLSSILCIIKHNHAVQTSEFGLYTILRQSGVIFMSMTALMFVQDDIEWIDEFDRQFYLYTNKYIL